MAEYRLYCLNGVNKITDAEWLEAKSDADAIVVARSLKKQTECELWRGDHCIGRIVG
jgi:hypothetical protein